jgi:hypothetical protein
VGETPPRFGDLTIEIFGHFGKRVPGLVVPRHRL